MSEDNQGLEKDPIRSNIAKGQVRDSHGRFFSKVDPTKIPPISVTTNQTGKVNTTNPPDLLSLKITNPLVYIKYWWKRIMANEGMELKFKAKPITAIAMAVVAFSLAFGLGGVVFPITFPWLKTGSTLLTPTPTPPQEIWKDTALKGTLSRTKTSPIRFYLVTTSTEAVYLETPDEINLNSLVGKRILAIGTYNSKDKILQVEDIQDLEVLPSTPVPIPTSTPTPSPKPTEAPILTPTLEPTTAPLEVIN